MALPPDVRLMSVGCEGVPALVNVSRSSPVGQLEDLDRRVGVEYNPELLHIHCLVVVDTDPMSEASWERSEVEGKEESRV